VTKRWPPAHFGTLLAKLQSQFGGSAIFTGTTEDDADSRHAASFLSGPFNHLCGATTIPRLIALLSECNLMLANDTGPLHLAAALGTPCVAPYTCTTPEQHGPYGQAGGITTRVACGGSYFKQCPNSFECFAELSPQRLWPAVKAAMQNHQ
jgi:ADP-heptose:LPS heptosyltransferase